MNRMVSWQDLSLPTGTFPPIPSSISAFYVSNTSLTSPVTAASASKRGRTEEDVPVLTQHAAHFQQLQHPHPQVGALIHMWNMLPRLSPLQVNFLTALHIQVARYTQLAGERDRILSGNYNKDDPATSLPMTFAPPPFPELHTFWYHNDLATAVWSGVDNSLFHPIWPAPTPGLPWHIWVNTELGFLLNWTKGEEHMRHLAKMLVDDAANSRLAPEPTPWG